MKALMSIMLLSVGLVACGEKPQTLQTNPHDAPAHAGTGKAFVSPDWKPGDQASWESHQKARAQYGMNDYTRMN